MSRSEIDAAWDSAEYNAKRAEKAEARVAELESALKELRIRYHCAGRRPEECHEMSIIDDALGSASDE